MGTRSTIALEFADGTVGQIYCHWDGYLDHNGKILQGAYTDPFEVRSLLDAGDMSCLGENIEGCEFYSQRGEECPQRMFKDFAEYVREAQFEEYDYILRKVGGESVWFVRSYATYDDFIPLEKAFLAEKEYAE
jgi:hypothetical protein